MPERWGLSASPLSAAFRARILAEFGADLRIAILSEMRTGSGWSLICALRRVRADEALVVLEDGGSMALAPVLKLLVSLTRCRGFAVIDGTLRRIPFGRASGLFESFGLIWATLSGFWSAVQCYIELRRLKRTPRVAVPRGSLQRAAFLRTNLWFGLKAGGSVGHIAGVVNTLARRCERVDVLTPDALPMIAPAIPVTVVAGARRYGYPYELNYYRYQRRFVRAASKILSRARPGFLYHRLSLGNYAGIALARRLKVPLVLEYNGSEVWVASHWGTPLRFARLAQLAEDVPLAQADLITTVSDVLGEELRARGVAPERIVVHPNGVDPEFFDPRRFSPTDCAALRQKHGIQSDAVVCTFVGTFGRWHGVVLLAEVIAALVAEHEAWLRDRNVRFLLVGDGLFMNAVRETLSGAPSRYVALAGLVPQDAAAGYLAASDIVVSPHVPNPDGSRFFGSPTKIFEYMAMEKAIIASDLEQIGQVLQPSWRAAMLPADPPPEAVAVLTQPGSRAELLASIRFLAERPAVRTRLGVQARRRVLECYTWDHNVSALLTRVHELLGA